MEPLARVILNRYQKGIPISEAPYADIARELGVTEHEVLEALRELDGRGVLSRVGPVFRAGAVGASTLAAMAVPPAQLDSVARLVSAFPEVNHNYEREHELNLWFVLTARDEARIHAVLNEIQLDTGLDVIDLPLQEAFHIDLGFAL